MQAAVLLSLNCLLTNVTKEDAAMPTTVEQLVLYLFGCLAAYFLWSIKRELTGLRTDIKQERDARGIIESKIASIETRCEERHKFPIHG